MNLEKVGEATTGTAAAIAAGVALGAAPVVQDLHGRPIVFVPEGVSREDLTAFLPAPPSLAQGVTLDTPDAFTAYVTLFAEPLRSIVFASRPRGRFDAVLDYHAAPASASWCRHRAVLTLALTPAWVEWTGANRRQLGQADFAQFLEDHVPDIAKPTGAELLEVARHFEAKKGVTFQSSQRVADGSVQFAYSEDVQGSARAGAMKVPTEFVLGLAPYEGTKPYAVTARLRYRIGEGGKLVIWYDLLRIQDVLDAAYRDVYDAIAAKLAGVVRAIVLGGMATTPA